MSSQTIETGRPRHRRRVFGPVAPLSDDEKALARALASELERVTALVADDGNRRLPECSFAARVLTEFLRLNRGARERIGAAARKTAGDTTPGFRRAAASDAGPFEIDPALQQQLRSMARRRLDALRPEISATIDRTLRGQAGVELSRVSATTVDLKLSGEPDSAAWRREINISSPEMIDVRWRSAEIGAARGYWELRGPAFLGYLGNVLASGYLPDVPGDRGVGGYFSIALSNYLPPTPPQGSTTYRVRVRPLARASRFGTYTGPIGVQPLTEVQGIEPIAPEGIGPWSRPAVIRYGQSYQTPPQHFDIEPVTVYRKLRFVLDWLRLVEDQSGPGNEELHIAGFVLQSSTQGGVVAKFGPSGFNLDPDDRNNHAIGTQTTFNLPPTTNLTYWPRTYTAVVSLMEKDDGGEMNDWLASLTTLADEMAAGAVAADINAFLNEVREEIEEKQAELVAEAVAEAAAMMATMIATAAREAISAFIAALVAWIAAAIRVGAQDDFYGTQAFGFVLWTNDADRIADGSAAEVFTSRVVAEGGTFTGSEQPDGSFVLDLTELQFLGLGGALEGSPTSGIVNVGLHWEFRDKLDL